MPADDTWAGTGIFEAYPGDPVDRRRVGERDRLRARRGLRLDRSAFGGDLVNTGPDQLKSVVANDVLPKWSNDIAAALREHPSMSLADKDFRDSMADAVAHDARTEQP